MSERRGFIVPGVGDYANGQLVPHEKAAERLTRLGVATTIYDVRWGLGNPPGKKYNFYKMQ